MHIATSPAAPIMARSVIVEDAFSRNLPRSLMSWPIPSITRVKISVIDNNLKNGDQSSGGGTSSNGFSETNMVIIIVNSSTTIATSIPMLI
jgi:hypothetical protein